MSIAAMTRLASLADSEKQGEQVPEIPGKPDRAASAQNALSDALAKVTAYIPTEVLAIYVPALGIANTSRYLWLWIIFGISAFLVLVFVWLHNDARRVRVHRRRRFALVVLFALVPFVAYAAAIPDTPFKQITSAAPRVGGIAVLILAVLLPELAKRWHIRPQTGRV
jgi:hypothetical protein